MNKQLIITALLALVTMAGQGQTAKTATIKGYSPALKDGTVAESLIDMVRVASDTVKAGHFTMTVPVEKVTECYLILEGEGCPNLFKSIFVAPGTTVSMTGEDCLFPTWKIESPLPEQNTANRIMEHIRDAMNNMLQLSVAKAPYEKQDSAYLEMIRQTIEVLPSVPIDIVSITEMSDACHYARNVEDFPYMEQLKAVEKSFAERAPKGYENELAYIHSLVYPLHVLQPGEEAVDADFFDMQGNAHHLAELRGRYILFDFWSLGCGPCRMAEPEMREVRERLNGRLEIVGINRDKPSAWQESDWSKKIVWPNWSDGKMGKGGIESRYCDNASIPYYVLLSPDHHIVWKSAGYGPGIFFGMATAIDGPRQDNSKNLMLAIRKVEANAEGTVISFRYYGQQGNWFRIANSSFLTANGRSSESRQACLDGRVVTDEGEANGKRYKVTAAHGITLGSETYPNEKASTATEGVLNTLYYTDFTLTFEPFDTIPATFDFYEGDGERDFVIKSCVLLNEF